MQMNSNNSYDDINNDDNEGKKVQYFIKSAQMLAPF